MIQTLSGARVFFPINISHATKSVSEIALAVLRNCGTEGNSIFFICSAWFLLDKKKINAKKIFIMWIEVWCVSVLFLFFDAFIGHQATIDLQFVVRCFFPIIYSNNWYVDCYILFCLIFPLLNRLISVLSKRALLKAALISFLLCFVNFIWRGIPFYLNEIVTWCLVYFMIAYFKIYMPQLSYSWKFGMLLFLTGLLGQICMILLINFLGLHITLFSNALQSWNVKTNIFIWFRAVGLLIIANQTHFCSKWINKWSSLTLLVYVLHENLILRSFYRPKLFDWLYAFNGYSSIVLWVLAFAIVTFLFSSLVAFIWKISIGKCLKLFSDWVYPKLEYYGTWILDRLEQQEIWKDV